MRIDYDLCRQILIDVANAPTPTVESNYSFEYEGISQAKIDYNIHKLVEEGFLTGLDASSKTGLYDIQEIELTVAGDKYLQKVENANSWQMIKAFLSDHAVAITFQAIETVAKYVCAKPQGSIL